MSYTPPKRPTLRELAASLERVTGGTLLLLLKVLKIEDNEGVPLPLAAVVKLAFYDWVASVGMFGAEKRLTVLLHVEPGLALFADKYEREELIDPSARTPAIVSVLDFQYAMVHLAGLPPSPFVQIDDGERFERMPYHALTVVTCDLNVLILRLFARMEKVRKLQERKDAADTASAVRDDANAP